jgi:ABC transporter family protein
LSATGSWTRAAIGARAALAVVLALAAAVLLVDLAEWRYVRLDLTAKRSSTLDPAVLDVLDKLPEPVVIDVFLRPLARPYDAVFAECYERTMELLAIVRNARRQSLEVEIHDAQDFEGSQERLSELGTDGTNKLVLTCGGRSDEIELFGELCTVDWGTLNEELVRYLVSQGIPDVVDPRAFQPGGPYRPARLQEFNGEELLLQSLLKVSSGKAPRAYFAKGHGEPALDVAQPTDLSRLRSVLERDGFEVHEWDPLTAPDVPAECDVLALIGPAQPYQAATREAVQRYAEAGGRVLAAPGIEEVEERRTGGLVELLASGFGITTRPGRVCQPLIGYAGEKVDGNERCSWLVIDERGFQPGHPLTEPLRMRGRRVQFTLSASFEGGYASASGTILPLVSSPADSWRDLEPYDYRFDPSRGEARGRQALVTAKQLRASKQADGSVRQGRVVAVASAYFFADQLLDVNRDFALNAFNWLAEREYRLAVRPLEKNLSFLDLERTRARPILAYTLWLGLPGLCAVLGLVVFLRRRK